MLQRGPNLIHSDEEFRREYALQFPGIPLGNISDGCSGVENRHAYFELDPAWQRKNLVAAIEARQKAIAAFKEQQRYSTGLRTFMLSAAIEETSVVIQRMNEQLAELDRGGPPERYLKQAPFQRLRRAEFLSLRRAIQLRALRDACGVGPAASSGTRLNAGFACWRRAASRMQRLRRCCHCRPWLGTTPVTPFERAAINSLKGRIAGP